MELNEYQRASSAFDVFTHGGDNVTSSAWIDKVLGLGGEAGEVSDKFKKVIRDHDGVLDESVANDIVKELGDVLWYVAAIARYMGVDLDEVARQNIEKLTDRRNRNLIHGNGDNR